MKLKFFLINLLLITSVFGQTPNGGYVSPAAGSGAAGQTRGTGPSIIYATDYGVVANTKWVKDASITNTSGVVTCPNSDCNFTAADVGKTVFVGNGILSSTAAIPLVETTISSLNNANSINVGATATATQTGTAELVWGTIDNSASNPAIQNAWNAWAAQLKTSPAVLQFPCGAMLVEGGIGSNPTINPQFMPTLAGCGPAATVFIPTPNFVFATSAGTGNPTCSAGATAFCFFGGVAAVTAETQYYLHDFLVFGVGMGATANCSSSGTFGGIGSLGNSMVYNVYINAWCGSGQGHVSPGMSLAAPTTGINIQVDSAGSIGMQLQTGAGHGSQPINIYWAFAGDVPTGLSILGTGPANLYGGTYTATSCGQALNMGGAAFVNSYGELIQGLNVSANASTFNIYGDVLSAANCAAVGPLHMNAGGATVNLSGHSEILPSGTTQTAISSTSANDIVRDVDGTTNISPGTTSLASGAVTFVSPKSINGFCTGVGTAASTLGLYGTGPNETATTCTSTTIGSGIPMTASGTFKGLSVTATAAGTNASSGVVTVLKNGAGTALTCTVGTGTTCTDYVHNFAFVSGDLISIQFTTQAADTLAGVSAKTFYQ